MASPARGWTRGEGGQTVAEFALTLPTMVLIAVAFQASNWTDANRPSTIAEMEPRLPSH